MSYKKVYGSMFSLDSFARLTTNRVENQPIA